MARKKDDMINEIMAWFDFDKVQKVMVGLDWEWYDEGVPTIQLLKEAALERMESAIQQVLSPNNKEHHDIGWISNSGGFKATAWKSKKGKLKKVRLEFIVSDWDSEND